MSKRMIGVGMVSVGLAAVASLLIHQALQASSWPSLDQEPPLAVSEVASPTESWFALEAVMSAAPRGLGDKLQGALLGEGMPADRGRWDLAADQLTALSPLLESSRIISPTRSFANRDDQPSLLPLVSLAEAQILRGWDRHADGASFEAAEDMLLADRLGQQLGDGSQSLFMSVVGLSIQGVALRELQELLSLSHDPLAHELVAEVLPVQAPDEGRFRAVMRRECADVETLLLDPLQSAAAVGESWNGKRLPRILYDIDATVAQHRRWCRAADAWVALLPDERGEPPMFLPEGLSEVLTYNSTGVEYLKILSNDASLNMADGVRKGQLQREVLRLLTAARLHGFANSGQLPAQAGQLVPEYLAAVPRDPFTGAELEIVSGQIEDSQEGSVSITLPKAPGEP